jgi:hypothetical protein
MKAPRALSPPSRRRRVLSSRARPWQQNLFVWPPFGGGANRGSGWISGTSSRKGRAERRGTGARRRTRGDRARGRLEKSHGGTLVLKWASARRMRRPWWSNSRRRQCREPVLSRHRGGCPTQEFRALSTSPVLEAAVVTPRPTCRGRSRGGGGGGHLPVGSGLQISM